jgi:hypothetical protein
MNHQLCFGTGTGCSSGSRKDLQPLTTASVASEGHQDWRAVSRHVTGRPNINAGARLDLRVRDLREAACSENFGKAASCKGGRPVDFRMGLSFYRTSSRYVVRLYTECRVRGVAPMFADTSLTWASAA